MRRLVAALAASFGCCCLSHGQQDSPLKQLDGSWTLVGVEMDGLKLPHPLVPVKVNGKLVIEGKQFVLTVLGVGSKGDIVVDVKSKPMRVDFIFKEGRERGKTMPGLFRLADKG